MDPKLQEALERWRGAELLGSDTLERILAFEEGRQEAPALRLRWPVLLALTMGGLMVGAGMLLFVAAHWDGLSPAQRFLLVLTKVLGLHAAGLVFRERMPTLATALHGLGTLAFGAGIFLVGQIFNLQEHWPGGLLLWALGAGLGWFLLRDVVQAGLTALLVPLWLTGEWIAWAEARSYRGEDGARVILVPLFLLALTYFTGRRGPEDRPFRKVLVWLGGLALLPLGTALLVLSTENPDRLVGQGALLWTHLAFVLAGGSLLSLVPAFLLRGRAARVNLLALGWAMPLALIQFGDWTAHAWSALGCIGLVAWGLVEGRRERLNLGMAGFALTVFVFYFAQVMDKLGRSLGLMGLGLLFLGGGWQLERLRRRLSQTIVEGAR